MRALFFLLLIAPLGALAGERLLLVKPALYSGMADASGAVPVSSNLFVAASDEDNILRLYRSDRSGAPLKQFDCNAFLELHGKNLEADLEAAARIGDRAFWIGSHGRKQNGKDRPNRCRLFATDIKVIDGEVALKPVGKPCKTLLDDLIADPRFDRFHFAAASRRAPKGSGALNIEGLAATPEGHLLIGFRNPIPEGKALLIPLLNPDEVIEGKAGSFEPAILLDLAGLGVRDISCYGGTYLIIAGSFHGGGHFQLYRWPGPGTRPQRLPVDSFGDYHPEALIIYPQKGLQEVQVLSDDGNRLIDGVPGKKITDPARQTFRSFWLRE